MANSARKALEAIPHALEGLPHALDTLPRLRLEVVRPAKPQRHPVADAMAFLGGALIGASIGALAGIFFAPSDGRTLRRRLSDQLGIDLGGWDADDADTRTAPAGGESAACGGAGFGEPAESPATVPVTATAAANAGLA